VTAALFGIWLALGGMVEVSAYHKRELARQQRAQAVVEANAAKLMRFADGCIRGEPSPIDDLLYDCRDVRLMRLPASAVRPELLAMAVGVERADVPSRQKADKPNSANSDEVESGGCCAEFTCHLLNLLYALAIVPTWFSGWFLGAWLVRQRWWPREW
jgi:hypothetical protein